MKKILTLISLFLLLVSCWTEKPNENIDNNENISNLIEPNNQNEDEDYSVSPDSWHSWEWYFVEGFADTADVE
jgi:hypothetical protein